jgi:hypothetical protein
VHVQPFASLAMPITGSHQGVVGAYSKGVLAKVTLIFQTPLNFFPNFKLFCHIVSCSVAGVN